MGDRQCIFYERCWPNSPWVLSFPPLIVVGPSAATVLKHLTWYTCSWWIGMGPWPRLLQTGPLSWEFGLGTGRGTWVAGSVSCEFGSWEVDIWYLLPGLWRGGGWLAEEEERVEKRLGGFPVFGTQPCPRARLQPCLPTCFSIPVVST